MPGYDDKRFTRPAPVAEVTLRDPDHGQTLPNVPMLIDCGADVSFCSNHVTLRGYNRGSTFRPIRVG
jgi:hypothetical protein